VFLGCLLHLRVDPHITLLAFLNNDHGRTASTCCRSFSLWYVDAHHSCSASAAKPPRQARKKDSPPRLDSTKCTPTVAVPTVPGTGKSVPPSIRKSSELSVRPASTTISEQAMPTSPPTKEAVGDERQPRPPSSRKVHNLIQHR
jgi:hypothetical protein